MQLELFLELVLIVLRCQSVAVRGSEELHALGTCQLLKDVDHLGVELFEHLNHRSADADRAVELTLTQVDHVFDGLAKRQIRSLYKPVNMFLRSQIIVVVMIMTDFKETISLQTVRTVHLEAKTYIFHNSINY